MNWLSVVIITRNEEHNIGSCIRCARLVSDDIVVVDSGSTDRTIERALTAGARVVPTEWKGYGASRNLGAENAKHNWILALDADERISAELAGSIKRLENRRDHCIYRFRRENYLGNRKIRFGTLGFETVKRMYNRNHAKWDLTLVHERLVAEGAEKKIIRGHISHYGMKDAEDYKGKALLYAQMSAEKYFLQGRTASLLKRTSSPVFNSVKSYFFQLGFLDGREGWTCAKTIARYSWLKYFYLHQLLQASECKRINMVPGSKAERA